jgi:hypothetical protein
MVMEEEGGGGLEDGGWTLGWVDIGTRTKVPLRFVFYLSKVTKIVTASSLVKTFWVMHYIEALCVVKKFFFLK